MLWASMKILDLFLEGNIRIMEKVNNTNIYPLASTISPVVPTRPLTGIDVLKDNYEYKILSSVPGTTVVTLQSAVNTHLLEGWKLYGNMVTEVIPGFNGSYGPVSAKVTYSQAVIKKLASKGGARSRKNYKK